MGSSQAKWQKKGNPHLQLGDIKFIFAPNISFFKVSKPIGGIKLTMNFHETYWLSGISVDDAGRVEDPTLCVRPCKNPIRGGAAWFLLNLKKSALKRNFFVINSFYSNVMFY